MTERMDETLTGRMNSFGIRDGLLGRDD